MRKNLWKGVKKVGSVHNQAAFPHFPLGMLLIKVSNDIVPTFLDMNGVSKYHRSLLTYIPAIADKATFKGGGRRGFVRSEIGLF